MSPTHPRPMRVAAVSYLNAKPLIWGLEEDPAIELLLDVPARLVDLLANGSADVALLPVIDYQRVEGLVAVPAGGIGSDGPTLTVRIFSKVPAEAIRALACDPDSHTSVALARVLLGERFGNRPEFVPPGRECDARLLIGDKVVCEDAGGDWACQIDLGEQWKKLTGLPFVFAVWTAREGAALGDLPRRLARAREQGLANVGRIIARDARPRGWPVAVAHEYLTRYLKYDVGERELESIRRFHALAEKWGVVGRVRPLGVYPMER